MVLVLGCEPGLASRVGESTPESMWRGKKAVEIEGDRKAEDPTARFVTQFAESLGVLCHTARQAITKSWPMQRR